MNKMVDQELVDIFSNIQHDIELILDFLVNALSEKMHYEETMDKFRQFGLLVRKIPKVIQLHCNCNWLMLFNDKLWLQNDCLTLQRPYLDNHNVTGMGTVVDILKIQKAEYEEYFNAIEELIRMNEMDILLPNFKNQTFEDAIIQQPGMMLNDSQMKRLRHIKDGIPEDICLVTPHKCIHVDWPNCSQCDVFKQHFPDCPSESCPSKNVRVSIPIELLDQLGDDWFDNIDNNAEWKGFMSMLKTKFKAYNVNKIVNDKDSDSMDESEYVQPGKDE